MIAIERLEVVPGFVAEMYAVIAPQQLSLDDLEDDDEAEE